MCFVFVENLLDSATEIQLWLSSKNLQKTSDFGRWISKVNYTTFISNIKGITSQIACINEIYSTYVVLKAISVCNLLHHNNGHLTYVITHPVRDMKFLHYRHLLETIYRQIWHLRNNRWIFLYRDCKICLVCITVNFYMVNPHMYTCSWGTLRCVWHRICVQDTDDWKIVHTGLRPLAFMVVWIPKDRLTYQPLPCDSIQNSFLY